MENKTYLVCPYCKDDIILEDDKVLYYGTKQNTKVFYHETCLLKKLSSKKRGALKEEDFKEFISSIINETFDMKKRLVDERRLYDWIHIKYNVVVLPSYFKSKMNKIFDGDYEGQTQPMSPEIIHEIWQKLFYNNTFSKIRQNNVRRGVKLSGLDLINYELGVVRSKYDSYIKWKRNIEINKDKVEDVELLTQYINYKKVKTEQEEKDMMIGDAIESLFLEDEE